jgi:predicted Fe-Mo cluster-binding NifX family protein
MKVAAVTEDGHTISSHFGMAPAYRVFTIISGEVTGQEDRPKPHHAVHPDHSEHHSHEPHPDMFAPVLDCQVLLCGGMGEPAYHKAQAAGLQVVLAGGPLEAALTAFLNGTLSSDLKRVHRH